MGQHGEYRTLVGAATATLALLPGSAEAACRLALLLALDMSSSVDAEEGTLQRAGLARALLSEPVRAAALSMPGEPVALAAFEWSGRYQQVPILGWTLIESAADLEAAAVRIAGSERIHSEFPTAMGFALGHAASWFGTAPACLFQTLDLSGDGVNNDGFGPRLAYKHFPFEGVTVNGLVVTGHDENVAAYYAAEVLHGPGAFLEIAEGFADFERAMRRKLTREMAMPILGSLASPSGQ
ncbi:uncharacterized protein DUF1194 [Palleronia aestuarii]|uniref:Uncharacterized protein DUF1194 n=1 Tax=Palleronia aestuarii TaxID=568105 RepID=A0A2W7NYC6_9RHOB|nr:DUF1194 domain-containing protein [Palleronia aestuarii]PZX18286.1 uncharacterized protein DUF1194 [Palleronia aestuarii]